jgi:hypothetical protein
VSSLARKWRDGKKATRTVEVLVESAMLDIAAGSSRAVRASWRMPSSEIARARPMTAVRRGLHLRPRSVLRTSLADLTLTQPASPGNNRACPQDRQRTYDQKPSQLGPPRRILFKKHLERRFLSTPDDSRRPPLAWPCPCMVE